MCNVFEIFNIASAEGFDQHALSVALMYSVLPATGKIQADVDVSQSKGYQDSGFHTYWNKDANLL